ncbi:MAG TPA: SGNH/GDSL hydrolase family protein [Candidatus Saccharimonadales bacterium]|nr:SGNH/GDSL hydrolase family protein [Candidatus Saccharimonadales bacterium]
MKQIFILGASSVYGVGAERAGWGDLVKAYVNSKIYSPDGPGETCEVFNFAKAGSTVEFVTDTLPWICQNYQRGPELTILISVGGNDAKAQNTPDNYVCTPEAFREKITTLCSVLKVHSKHVIFVSNGYVDETKVSPKPSPFNDGNTSYFTNERRAQFNAITQEVCQSMGFDFVAVDCDKDTWIRTYLYKDGLHPNQAGYELVFEALKPALDKTL